jgi:hypothetical protein
LDIPGIIIDEE